MRTIVVVIPAYMRLALATMFQYRWELVLWAVWGVVYPAVAMAMWSAAVAGSADGQTIRGFLPSDFAAYFWLSMVIGHFTTAWDVYEMGYLVRSGHLSPRLLRPILPVWQSVADNLAYKMLTLTILVPIWLLVIYLAQPTFDTSRHNLLMAIPAILMAAVINYLWCYILGMLAFWVTKMDAIGQAWFGAGLFFGGRMAPMEIMPEPLQKVASALPFKWVIWFPCETMMGRLSDRAVVSGLINQVAWVAFSLVVFHLMWRFAVKRYTAVGS